MVHNSVDRRISDDIEANPSWSLIYGRRKVYVCRRPIDTDEVEVLTPDDLVNMAKVHLQTR